MENFINRTRLWFRSGASSHASARASPILNPVHQLQRGRVIARRRWVLLSGVSAVVGLRSFRLGYNNKVVARSPGLPGPGFALPELICCRTRWSNRTCIDSKPISGSRHFRFGGQIIGALKSGERYQVPISDPPF